MAHQVDVVITVYESRIRALGRTQDAYDFIRGRAEEAAQALRASAPVRTGAGKASIKVRMAMGNEGWVGAASWDTSHYYMGILNAEDRWADRAAASVRYV